MPDEASQLPPPSFSFLVATHAAQLATLLGQTPNPMSGKTEVRLEMARHFIETLAILEEKTKGNLTADEAQLLTAVLHNSRLGFIEAQKRVAGAP
jgi:ABC-type transport system involved in cytochrome bd biosynthesis fused ATPase/permease subunit